jgi:hypothetical protein
VPAFFNDSFPYLENQVRHSSKNLGYHASKTSERLTSMFNTSYQPLVVKLLALMVFVIPVCSEAKSVKLLNSLLESAYSAHITDGYVDYTAIKDNRRFVKYFEVLETFDVESLHTKEDQTAFWINTYNALAVKMVTEGVTPVNTLGRLKFFRTNEHLVGGKEYDLNSIESIVTEFDDPRVYFALTDAAYTAPQLSTKVYLSENISKQLDEATSNFVNDNRKNRFLKALEIAKLSKIFERNSSSFGDSETELIAWVAEHVKDEEVQKGLRLGRYKIEYLDYEYSINGKRDYGKRDIERHGKIGRE